MVKNRGKGLGMFTFILVLISLGLGGYALYNSLMLTPQPEEPEIKARAYLTATYPVSTSTWHTVNFNALDYNIGSDFSLATDSFNCSYAGYYLISGMASLELLPDGNILLIGIYKNDTVLVSGSSTHSSHHDFISVGVTDLLYLEEGDSVKLKIWHSYGSDRYVYGSTLHTYTYLSIMLT
jgi:hypothetical protein